MSFLCCECCLNLLPSWGSKKLQKSYKPNSSDDLDQQELMAHNISKQAKQLPNQYFIDQDQSNDIDHAKQMNVQLQLNTINKLQESKQSQTKAKEDNDNHDSDRDHSDNNQSEELQQQLTEEKLKPNYSKFSINIDPYDKYYKLLHEKTQNLQTYFNFAGKPIEIGQTQSKLKIQKIDTKRFNLSFQLPCSYSFYAMLMKDSNIANKKFMSNFQKCQVLQAFKPNFTRNMTRLKRYSMLQPRQFIYLKYSNGSFKQNWEICLNESQSDLLSQLQQGEYKRCDIFSISNFKQINNKLYAKQFIQIDLQANNMNFNMWGKIMAQVKDYYQKLHSHIQNYYQKELL